MAHKNSQSKDERKHNLEKVLESCRPPENEPVEVKQKVARLMITRTDLRGIDNKIHILKSTPLCTGWMIFLNQAGTLAHIMHAEDVEDGTYIRMRIPAGIAGAHEEFMRRWFYNRMVSRYVI